MKVYVVVLDIGDGPEFDGLIFSTKEKAQEYINKSKSYWKDDYEIVECVVDGGVTINAIQN